jgi:predicted ATPase with chaperone activity
MIERLGSRIVKKGLISENDLKKALERQRLYGGRIGFNLIELGLITEADLNDLFHFKPIQPHNVSETGIDANFLADLILKHCLFMKKFKMRDLSQKTQLSSSVILNIVDDLRKDGFIEIVQGDGSLNAFQYEYRITDKGINRSIHNLEECRYVGPAPVSLEEYKYAVEVQTIKSIEISMGDLKKAFSDLIVSEEQLKIYGAAINSVKPIFLYGPSGNGKTTIAEYIGQSLPGEIYVPHAVLAGNQIIIVYDQVNHREVYSNASTDHFDKRWIKIRRPIVFSGGELTLKTLDLDFNPHAKYYEAPLQMKANNGLFIVDDFGRQMVDPQTLLNRWIIPLDRQTDYLTLHTGMKFEIPFDQLVIFATNLPPKQIADDAFLRRLRYKIKIDHPPVEEFVDIFKKVCTSNKLVPEDNVFNHLIEKYQRSDRKFSSCHPRDLIDQIIDFAHFVNKPPRVTKAAIDKAWEYYFEK